MQNLDRNASADDGTGQAGYKLRHFQSSDGVILTADELGPKEAPVVVLLHGGGQTRHSWSRAVSALAARGYRVINFDARGHGDSDWSPDGAYGLDDRVADLRAIIQTLDRPYALVGASLGGGTAIHAVAAGATPAALVLVDIVPNPEPAGVDRIVAFMRANPEGFATLEEAADAVAAYNPERVRSKNPDGLMRNLRLGDDGRLYWHWDPQITATDSGKHQTTIRQSAEVLARGTNLPVLLVRGLKSDVVSDASVASFRAILPSLEVADVGDAGHMVAGDRNDAFNSNVIAFLLQHLPLAITA